MLLDDRRLGGPILVFLFSLLLYFPSVWSSPAPRLNSDELKALDCLFFREDHCTHHILQLANGIFWKVSSP
jgi:hypothetical protein